MNEAWLGSIDITIKKTKTGCFFDMPTSEMGKLSQAGGSLYNIERSNDELITFPGVTALWPGFGKSMLGLIGT
jgi:uncharacterized protein GlcG (DUF336 family)